VAYPSFTTVSSAATEIHQKVKVTTLRNMITATKTPKTRERKRRAIARGHPGKGPSFDAVAAMQRHAEYLTEGYQQVRPFLNFPSMTGFNYAILAPIIAGQSSIRSRAPRLLVV
jgi:hypothetical protein